MFGKRRSTDTPNRGLLNFDLECLEQRQMLAGDVGVALSGDTLVVSGDDDGNRIEVVIDANTITLEGRGTDINGGRDPVVFNADDVAQIDVDLFGGNDRFEFVTDGDAGAIGDSLEAIQVFTGDGNDQVTFELTDWESGLDLLNVGTGNGNDRFTFEADNFDAFFDDGFGLFTGEGSDRVEIELGNSSDIDAEAFFVDSGGGRDRLNLQLDRSEIFGERIDLLTGGDRDQVNFEIVDSGLEAEVLNIDTGNDSDRLEIELSEFSEVSAQDSLFVSTGSGDDRVNITAEEQAFIETEFLINISTGEGRDQIELAADGGILVSEEDLVIDSGNGDDLSLIHI